MRILRNSSVRVYHPWNYWYFPMEILGIQVSPVSELRGVGWDNDGELLYMTTWLPLCVQLYPIRKGKLKMLLQMKLE
jgi:hypothetical protein